MTEAYKVDSSHRDSIVDITLTDFGQIITTSKDDDLRFFNMTNGIPIFDPMCEMECDQMASQGAHLVTRVGSGDERMILIWNQTPNGGVDETPCCEFELSEQDKKLADTALDFKMKIATVLLNADN